MSVVTLPKDIEDLKSLILLVNLTTAGITSILILLLFRILLKKKII